MGRPRSADSKVGVHLRVDPGALAWAEAQVGPGEPTLSDVLRALLGEGARCRRGNCKHAEGLAELREQIAAERAPRRQPTATPVVAAPLSVPAQKADVIADLQAKINAVQSKPAAPSWATEDDPWGTPYEPELETPEQRSLRLQAEAGQENQDVVGEEPA